MNIFNLSNIAGQRIKFYVGLFVCLVFGNTYIKENPLEDAWVILLIF